MHPLPTRKPRVALSLPPDLEDVLRELSAASDKPLATVIVDLLKELQPALGDLAKIVRAAKSGKKAAAKRALQHMVGNALAEQLTLISGEKK
jgi:hypothetical protein